MQRPCDPELVLGQRADAVGERICLVRVVTQHHVYRHTEASQLRQ
jgi:hypothetical protein